jgi:hypothetical protein
MICGFKLSIPSIWNPRANNPISSGATRDVALGLRGAWLERSVRERGWWQEADEQSLPIVDDESSNFFCIGEKG